MKRTLIILSAVIAVAGLLVAAVVYRYFFYSPYIPPVQGSVYDFTMKNIDGQDVRLDAYRGQVVMIVNTASKCGYTPQYEGLQALYDKYREQGFVVLGFPANNFMGQEPGSDEEIKNFCTLNFKVSFPMFSKISVRDADQHPLYRYLTGNEEFNGNVLWNFEKFLIDRNGKIVNRFRTRTEPGDPAVAQAIEAALGSK